MESCLCSRFGRVEIELKGLADLHRSQIDAADPAVVSDDCVPGCTERKANSGFVDIQSKVGSLIDKHIEWESTKIAPATNETVEQLLHQKELSVDETAAMRFDAAKTRVTFAVVNLASDVRLAYYELQGEEAKLPMKKDLLLAAEASSQFSQKVLKAGNAAEVEMLPRVAAFHQSKLDVRHAESGISSLYEKLSRLMGVNAADIMNRIPSRFPDVPEAIFDPQPLEERAIASRLDLEMQRQDVAIIDKARALRHRGVFTAVELGTSSERDSDGVRVTGPTLQMELPIFNRGQADRTRLLAQFRQSRAKLAALEITVRSEVREAIEQMASAQEALKEHREHILLRFARVSLN